MTVLYRAHLNLEGLVLDREARKGRDLFVTHNWSHDLCTGMCFSPERESVKKSFLFSQRRVNGTVRLRLYKGGVHVLDRSSATERLYSVEEVTMDSLKNFRPETRRASLASRRSGTLAAQSRR